MLDISKPFLIAKQRERKEELEQLLRESKTHGGTNLNVDSTKLHKLIGLSSNAQRGGFLFRGHLLVALVSRFDGFFSSVVRELLQAFPDRLGKKTLTYADAARCLSMDELRKRFIGDEIDSKMRESHKDQLDYLSTLANVSLASDEQVLFARFIEITERRNCHIHCDGRISLQYLRVCQTHNVVFKEAPKEGQLVNVTVTYFSEARRVLSEMAFKIAQTVVRKLFSDAHGLAEEHLSTVGIEMLKEQRWNEALMVFDYASSLRGTSAGDDSDRKRNVINRAQALVGIGNATEAMKAVASVDWSAAHPKFILAVHALRQEFDEAAALMPNATLDEDDYRTWPLFAAFRETDAFKRAYFSLFGHDFDQTTLGAVAEARAAIEQTDASPVEVQMVADSHGSAAKSEESAVV